MDMINEIMTKVIGPITLVIWTIGTLFMIYSSRKNNREEIKMKKMLNGLISTLCIIWSLILVLTALYRVSA